MNSVESTESVELEKYFAKNVYSNLLPLVQQTSMLPQRQKDTCERQDL